MDEADSFKISDVMDRFMDDDFNPNHTYVCFDFNKGHAFRLNPRDSKENMSLSTLKFDTNLIPPFKFWD